MAKKTNTYQYRTNGAKKTRQGLGRNTKMGNKLSSKHYKKKYRGQGR